MAMRVVKCTSCGYRFRADPEGRYELGEVLVIKGEKKPKPPLTRDKRTVDITCPNCEQEFEVEVEV